jgi:predicted nucleotidyltransferase
MNFQSQNIIMETIIDKLSTTLKPNPIVCAFWLVGSVAKATVDEYSDLDFWVDFHNECENTVFDSIEIALSSLASIDFKHKKTVLEKGVPHITIDTPITVHKRMYHLDGTSEHLRITFSWQEHNSLKKEYVFDENRKIEPVKILFDKNNLICSQSINPSDFRDRNKLLFDEAIYCRNRQSAFIEKNTSRLWYMESLYAYNRYVLESLITILRLIYTPAYPLKYLNHISQHIPSEELKKLEYFAKIASLDDMRVKVSQAGEWFDELEKKYKRLMNYE